MVDYIPAWRKHEEEKQEQAAKAPKAPPPEPITFTTQLCDQSSLFDADPAKEYTHPMQEDGPVPAADHGGEEHKLPGNLQKLTYANVYESVPPESLKDAPQ